ncbi:MAG: hypothetical protein ACLPPV_14245 [Candidatus Korobacteraceae bacterium]|jgi:hypothetical protein
MRPTGVVLIAVYHFLSALFLALFATTLAVGGTVLGTVFAGGSNSRLGGLGMMVGTIGGIFFFFYAVVAFVAGYGILAVREWGRILSIVLAVVSLLFALPGLLRMGLHPHLFFGGYHLFRIAISIVIIWYLVQPEIKSLFQRTTPATPQP